MAQKIEIDAESLHDLVYIWVRHVGIKQIQEAGMDEDSFIRGAGVFFGKLRELTPKKEVELQHLFDEMDKLRNGEVKK